MVPQLQNVFIWKLNIVLMKRARHFALYEYS